MALWLLSLVLSAPPEDPLASKTAPKLFKAVDLSAKTKPVGEFLKSFAAEHGLEIVIDGRIDAAAPVQGRFKKTFVERILQDAARFSNAQMVVVGEIVYVGPQESADRVAAAAVKAKQSLAKNENVDADLWKQKIARKWTAETTVQSLVVDLAKEFGVSIKNPDDLDVKAAAGSVKNAAPVDLLCAWTALADQTWSLEKDGKSIAISPLPEDARIERRVRTPSLKEANRRAGGYRELPDVALDVEVKGNFVHLTGPWSALWAAERLDREEALAMASAKTQKPGAKPTKGSAAKRYTVNFKNITLANFAVKVAEHCKVSIEIDEASLEKAGKSKSDRLNCVATGVEIEEMLELALEPVGLSFRAKGTKFVIFAGMRDEE